jgi:type IV pilus assembly protein PilX
MINIRKLAAARERGVALVIALVALVAMALSAMALIRSVDTGNVVAGNLAFRQSTLQTTDTGIETAFAQLLTIVSTSSDANWPSGCASGACNYYATRQTVDSRGIPSVINWTNVPSTTVNTNYSVQYVIDRLCDGPLPVTDITLNCYATTPLGGGSKKIGSTVFSTSQQIYYRATVRVSGPRNTVSVVQAIFVR